MGEIINPLTKKFKSKINNMKKVTSLMVAALFAGLTYGQITNESIPTPRNNNHDTIPPGWNGDSSYYKRWNDSLHRANSLDSLNQFDSTGRRTWENKDSMDNYKNNGNWQDTSMNHSWNNSMNKNDSNWNRNQAENHMDKNAEDHKKWNSDKDKMGNSDSTEAKKDLSDRVMMKDGEMVLILNGNEEKMDKDYKFPNGTLVTPDGTVKMINGKTVKLKDGQYLDIKKPTPTTKKKTKTKKSKE
jgi:hypothetical protein